MLLMYTSALEVCLCPKEENKPNIYSHVSSLSCVPLTPWNIFSFLAVKSSTLVTCSVCAV